MDLCSLGRQHKLMYYYDIRKEPLQYYKYYKQQICFTFYQYLPINKSNHTGYPCYGAKIWISLSAQVFIKTF